MTDRFDHAEQTQWSGDDTRDLDPDPDPPEPPARRALARVAPQPVELELSTDAIVKQVRKIQDVMTKVMKEGHHFGTIPGTNDKNVLFKAGAEKLNLTFRLSPTYRIGRNVLGGDHLEYLVTCTLTHIVTGQVFGQGVGSCSTLEAKYRWRQGQRLCPACGKPAIIRGKDEYGGGWLCFKKKDGCGSKFDLNDASIVTQQVGRVENLDLADTYNTVLKMAKKRAHVDATITALAVSDMFTQDVGDPEDEDDAPKVPPVVQKAPPAAPAGARTANTPAASPSVASTPKGAHKPAKPPAHTDRWSTFWSAVRKAGWLQENGLALLAARKIPTGADLSDEMLDQLLVSVRSGPKPVASEEAIPF